MGFRVRTILLLAFGLVVGFFGVATVVTVSAISRVQTLHERQAALNHAERQGHFALADIQELYIHQAHTLIAGDLSHVDHYRDSYRQCLDRLSRLEEAWKDCELTGPVGELRLCVDRMHRYFEDHALVEFRTGDISGGATHASFLEGLTSEAQTRTLALDARLARQERQVRQELTRLLINTGTGSSILLSLAVVAAALTGLVLVRAVGRPLASLHEAMGEIGAGRFDTRLVPRGPREIRGLTTRLNTMVDDIRESRRRLARNERMTVMGELAAGVAHELNNPLGVIIGYVKVMQRDAKDRELAADLAVIADEAAQCSHIVDSLLQLARPTQLDARQLDLAAMIRHLVDRHRMTESKPAAAIRVEVPDACTAYVDEFALKSVLVNLLKNACEAAGDGGTVRIGLGSEGDRIRLSFEDSGPGVPSGSRDDIFKPFHTTRREGIGLGLAISETIVRQHRGTLELTDSELGGACFTVCLPRGEAVEPGEPVVEAVG